MADLFLADVKDEEVKYAKLQGTMIVLQETAQRMRHTPRCAAHIRSEVTDEKQQFWMSYKTVAQAFDTKFYEKHNADVNTVMIFAGVSAGLSAIFAGMQYSRSPDPNAATQALLQALILSLNGATIPGFVVPVWNGPSTVMIYVQCLLYASLACSLFAALGSVMAKQWLTQSSSVGECRTLEARGLEHQRRLALRTKYHFHTVLEIFAALLQISVLLFGLGLSLYVIDNRRVVGDFVIIANTVGITIYFYAVSTLLADHSSSPRRSPLISVLKKFSAFAGQGIANSCPATVDNGDSTHSVRQFTLRLRNVALPFVTQSGRPGKRWPSDVEAQRSGEEKNAIPAAGWRGSDGEDREHANMKALTVVSETFTLQ